MSQSKPLSYAAIDLGSNSFHLLVATFKSGQIYPLDSVKYMVRLAAGLDHRKMISSEYLNKAYEALEAMSARIENIPDQRVRIVGTNTLRVAKNSQQFLARAEQILGHEIEIISGREEARMLYLGVAQSTSDSPSRKLVMDIGGGSTELIIGEGVKSEKRESLHMGCVSYTKKYFSDGMINEHNWKRALIHALQELNPFIQSFKKQGWEHSVGASGTMRATAKILEVNEFALTGITVAGLEQLKERCFDLGTIDQLTELSGLSEDRRPVFIGGLAIVYALMKAFTLQQMEVSTGALREGLIYEMLDGPKSISVTKRSIRKLVEQFTVDTVQAENVQRHSEDLLGHSEVKIKKRLLNLLFGAVKLHEIGLSIAHSQYHKIGAYVVQHADMPGFSNQQKLVMATLIRLHRRKISKSVLANLTERQHEVVMSLLVVLRLAVIFARNRHFEPVPVEHFNYNDKRIEITIKTEWLVDHPLIKADLKDEIKRWRSVGVEMTVNQPQKAAVNP
ncbi:Ppx/GppA phosphatase family protein [Marinicella sp. S1101]|uniref:Ppx/GppA phosphatase family protein n=1 Tax=Marinicella marina TaxID=2996016 RepID=UPI002260FDE5|nr:Ppx/GppA phosphatase family protein [Marinicella marina]MCX7553325.1 Ppx/GppA phosphatase family protein [Marinicella marina]MDJ1139057.1 Ppx/GppA phosphatase family protein [Marinicella marina]